MVPGRDPRRAGVEVEPSEKLQTCSRPAGLHDPVPPRIVHTRPPTRSRASSTVTVHPARCSS